MQRHVRLHLYLTGLKRLQPFVTKADVKREFLKDALTVRKSNFKVNSDKQA
jgi:hypothetical protein